MNKRRKKKPNTKFWVLIVTAIVGLLIVSVFLFYQGLKSRETEAIRYYEKSNLDYSVCLKENTYYETTCVGKDMAYIANLIDYLKLKFDYSYEMNTNVDYIYRYYIEAEVKVFEKSNPSNLFYNKVNTIKEEQEFKQANTSSIHFIDEIKVNYQEYNELIRSFKNEYGLIADSTLEIKMHIEVINDYEKFENQNIKKNVMNVSIPLTENTINIGLNYKNINESDVFVEPVKMTVQNYLFIGIAIVFLIFDIAMIAILIKLYISMKNTKNDYEKIRDRILKEYDHLIMSSITLIEEDRYEIYDVQDFKELAEIAERRDKTIMWTESVHENGRRSWFSIIDEEKLYRRLLEESEYIIKKEK